MTDKIYIPKSSAKASNTKIGEVIRCGFHVKTLLDFINKEVSGEWFNFDLVPRKEVKNDGVTHSIVLNTWKPDFNQARRAADSAPTPQRDLPSKPTPADDVPF